MQANTPLPEALTLDNILVNFATDEKARKFLERWLWPEGPTCPRCKSNDKATVYKMKGASIRPGLYNCRNCKRAFTATVGTIFEDSHIPLRKWLVAWFLMCSSKKGVSSLQMQRMLDLGSYRTALFMTHRIRHALKDTSHAEQLNGVIEMDETYVGGRLPPRGTLKKLGRPGPDSHKVPVVSLVQRDGSKRSMVMERITSANLKAAVVEHVKEGSKVVSDGYPAYRKIAGAHTHHSVNHSAGEYARKEGDFTVHTNTVESSFSLLKRGIMGAFHHISKHHLPLYLAEFDFRWNQRKVTDGERTVSALKKASGKRLTYKAIKQSNSEVAR